MKFFLRGKTNAQNGRDPTCPFTRSIFPLRVLHLIPFTSLLWKNLRMEGMSSLFRFELFPIHKYYTKAEEIRWRNGRGKTERVKGQVGFNKIHARWNAILEGINMNHLINLSSPFLSVSLHLTFISASIL